MVKDLTMEKAIIWLYSMKEAQANGCAIGNVLKKPGACNVLKKTDMKFVHAKQGKNNIFGRNTGDCKS